jgi:hypothetical protein
MTTRHQPSFSLRFLLIFTGGIGLLCAAGIFVPAGAIFAVTVLHFLLYLLGSTLADRFPSTRNPILRHRFWRPRQLDFVPFILILSYLVSLDCCRAFQWFIGSYGVYAWWYPQVLFGLPVESLEHAVIFLFQIYVLASFLGQCYGSGRVCRWHCAMTACFTALLLARHFAVWHV